jgi:hypothetical protein
VGVAPDLEVPAEEALATAYNAVLDVLLERAESEEARRRLEWARKDFEAGQNPTVLSREQLAEYCGTYETRSFSVSEAGVLQYHRDGESSFPMVPMGNDLFRFEGHDELRMEFARDESGAVDRVIALSADGTQVVRRRSR